MALGLWICKPRVSGSYSVMGKDCQAKMGGDHVLDVD